MSLETSADVPLSDIPAADISRLLNQIQADFSYLGPRLHDGIIQAVETASDLDPAVKADVVARLSPHVADPQQQYLSLLVEGGGSDLALNHDDLVTEVLNSPRCGQELDALVLRAALDRKIPVLEAVAILRSGPAVAAQRCMDVGQREIDRYLSATSSTYQQALQSASSARELSSSPDLAEAGRSAVPLAPDEQEVEIEQYKDSNGVELE